MKQLLSTLLLLCFAFSMQLQAQTLSVQGVIKNADNSAAENGFYKVTFRLYTVKTGGSSVWNETLDSVNVKAGTYSAILGETEPFPAFDAPAYYLGITIENGQELTPRSRMTAAPFALSLIGTENKFPNAGSVGIGTLDPQKKLHVVANGAGVLVESGSSTATIKLQNDHGDWRLQGPHSSGGRLELETGDNADIVFYPGGGMVAGSVTAGIIEAKHGSNVAKIDIANNDNTWSLNGPHPSQSNLLEFEYNDGSQFEFYTDGGFVAHGNVVSNAGVGRVISESTATNLTASVAIKNNNGTWSLNGPHNRANNPLEFEFDNGGQFEFRDNGHLYLTTLHESSDRRLKKDIQPLSNSLDNLNQLNGYAYHWKDDKRSDRGQIGVIAQEVQAVYPELVEENGEGMLAVSYSGLVPVLIEAVKEQQTQIDLLAAQNDKMDSQLGMLMWMVGGMAGLLLLLTLGYVVKKNGGLARGTQRGWQTAVGS